MPITFECGVLAGGISNFIAMWIACRLPKANPLIHDERFTDDMFGLIVPLDGVDEQEVMAYLKSAGAEEVKHVEV
jgi:hypothetical protein